MEDDKFCDRAHDDLEEDGEEKDTEDHRLERTPVAAPEISSKAQAGKVGQWWSFWKVINLRNQFS